MDQQRPLSNVAYSVLDLASVRQGSRIAETFEHSVQLAQHAEQWGYSRYWFAEHHNMISVASSATSLLIGHIAGRTKEIRVGSGGIMLPNHTPLIIAEQFGTLETLYPGRIDLGLGRAPGTDQLTAYAIRGERFHAQHDFPKEVRQLQQYLSAKNSGAKVRAIPGEGTDVPIWILGSSTDSAYLAAAYGLPYAFASHFAPQQLLKAIDIYRNQFRPSEYCEKPRVMAGINVVAASSREEAVLLSSSLKRLFIGVITGERQLLQPPVENATEEWEDVHMAALESMLAVSFIGDRASIEADLHSFIQQTAVDEVIVSSHIYDPEARLTSYRLLAEIMSGKKMPS